MKPEKQTFISEIANLVGGKLAADGVIHNLGVLEEAVVHGFKDFQEDLDMHRRNIIALRDEALAIGDFAWGIALSHAVAFLYNFQMEELPPPLEPTYPKHDRVAELECALLNIKQAIVQADPEVLTDTLWMPEDKLKGATVVDYIDGFLIHLEL